MTADVWGTTLADMGFVFNEKTNNYEWSEEMTEEPVMGQN